MVLWNLQESKTYRQAAAAASRELGFTARSVRDGVVETGGTPTKHYRELSERARIVLISPQPADKIRKLAARFDVPLDFWADTDNRAATVLARFIHLFLSHLLPTEGVDTCGNLLIREALEPTEAIEAVVADYMRPHQSMLISVLEIMLPEAGRRELSMGQPTRPCWRPPTTNTSS